MADESKGLDVLFLSEAYCTHTRRWSQATRQRGLNVAVLSFNPAQAIPGVPTLRFQVPGLSVQHLGRWKKRYRQAVTEILDRYRPRSLHMHFLEDWRLDRELIKDTPLVISIWGSDVMLPTAAEPADKRSRKVALLRMANQVTATTLPLALSAAAYGGLEIGDIEVIPFGVDTETFHPRPPGPRGPLTVGFVKHLKPIYGPDVLVRAFRLVLDRCSDARLLMVGGGPMKAELKALAGELGMASSVDFAGAIPHEQVSDAMRKIDVFVMPSRQEAFGVSALEAQACGVPVVASDLAGIRQAVLPGQSALMVPPDQVQPLADAIVQLLDSPDLRRQFGQAGRSFVEQNFRWSDCVDRMMDVYASLHPAHD